VRIGDRSLLPHDVWTAVESLPPTAGGTFQIVRSKCTETRLFARVGYDPTLVSGPLSALQRSIETLIAEVAGVECAIELVDAEEMVATRGGVKLKRVVDE
jgi:phenylacetate-CoA ligase